MVEESAAWIAVSLLTVCCQLMMQDDNCPISKLPVSPYDFMFTSLALFVINKCEKHLDQNLKDNNVHLFFLGSDPMNRSTGVERKQ